MREGVVRTYSHHNNRLGAMIEVSCDTDFVARTDDFLDFVDNLLMHIAGEQPVDIGDLLSQHYIFDDNRLVCEVIEEQNKKFGENIEVKDFVVWTLNQPFSEEE